MLGFFPEFVRALGLFPGMFGFRRFLFGRQLFGEGGLKRGKFLLGDRGQFIRPLAGPECLAFAADAFASAPESLKRVFAAGRFRPVSGA